MWAVEFRRWADQTFLTYPEWFLVFAPQNQADFLNDNTNTNYPYLADTAGIWQSYKIMYDQIKDKYNFNWWYHLMVFVIWISSSVEYNLKSFYELIIWNITDTNIPETTEDKSYAKFANNYVNFIYDIPWYEFDFWKQLKDFNSWNTFFWDHFFRKTERKVIINFELFAKYIYSKIIKVWTKWVYSPALPTTIVLLDKNPEDIHNTGKYSELNIKNIKLIKEIKNSKWEKLYLVSLPRYDQFKDYSSFLALNNIKFIEIAWNKWDIVISIIVKNQLVLKEKINILFTQNIVTKKGTKRITFTTKVSNLSNILKTITNNNIYLEHVFDY